MTLKKWLLLSSIHFLFESQQKSIAQAFYHFKLTEFTCVSSNDQLEKKSVRASPALSSSRVQFAVFHRHLLQQGLPLAVRSSSICCSSLCSDFAIGFCC